MSKKLKVRSSHREGTTTIVAFADSKHAAPFARLRIYPDKDGVNLYLESNTTHVLKISAGSKSMKITLEEP